MKVAVVSLLLLTASVFLVPEASASHCSPYPYAKEIVCRAGEAVCALVCYVIGDVEIHAVEVLA